MIPFLPKARHRIAALLVCSTAALAAASAAPVDSRQSRLTASFTQMNVPVDAAFTRFSGSVAFDAGNPAASHARLTVDTASFDIGDDDYNAEVRKKEWFDSEAHPQATFTSTQVRPLGGNRYEVTGDLALKGRTQTLKTEMTAKTENGRQVYEGSLPLSRKAFGIGDAEWDGVLEDTVMVKFRIVAPAN